MRYIKKGKERTKEDTRVLRQTVSAIIENVQENGDAALREYSEKFDGFVRDSIRVSREEIDAAYARMTEEEIADLKAALENIRSFAEAQRATIGDLPDFSPQPGIHLGHRVIPVRSCLCYVPGGRFPLYSTALMLVTPAVVAGVKRIAACAPVVHGTGDIHYKTLVAMDLAGATEIYAVGGAQAIAAFSYGTETIAPVDVIVGPGNQYVAEAKRQCYGQVGIDFIAGPSEVLVIADRSADPKVLAADLLAQCEHDPNAKGILLATDETLAKETIDAVEAELAELPTAGTARQSWDTFGEVVVLDSMEEAMMLSDAVTKVTHNHPEGMKGARAITAAVFRVVSNAALSAIALRVLFGAVLRVVRVVRVTVFRVVRVILCVIVRFYRLTFIHRFSDR